MSQPAIIPPTDLIGLVHATLASWPDQPPEKPIINLYGIAGIGKSSAMQAIEQTFASSAYVVHISFDLVEQQDADVLTWESLLAQLRTIQGFEGILDITDNDGLPLIAESAGGIIRIPGAPRGAQPILLLLDALDDVPAWKWIQQEIIQVLIERRLGIVVCTSQAPLFWHFWELREHCHAQPVERFTEQQTRQYLSTYQFGLLTKTFHAYSKGYPLALQNLVQRLGVSDAPLIVNPNDVQALREEFQNSDTAVSDLLIRLLRRVELDLLTTLAKTYYDQFERIIHADSPLARPASVRMQLLQAVQRLLEENLASGPDDTPRNEQDRIPERQHLAAHELLRSQNPQLYTELVAAITSHYQKQINERPLSSGDAFLEWCYFASIMSGSEWQAQFNQLLERITEALQRQNKTEQNYSFPRMLMSFFFLDAHLRRSLWSRDHQQYEQVYSGLIQLLGGHTKAEQQIFPFEALLTSSCSEVLQEIRQRLNPNQVLTTIDSTRFDLLVKQYLLSNQQNQQKSFEDYRAEISEIRKARPQQRQVNEDLLFLSSRGLVELNQRNRSFQVNNVLRDLLHHAMPKGV